MEDTCFGGAGGFMFGIGSGIRVVGFTMGLGLGVGLSVCLGVGVRVG